LRNLLFMKFYLSLAIISFFYLPPPTFHQKLSTAALTLVDASVVYDPAYTQIAYPNGDVPKTKGVCSDVVIRAYRKVGYDLQKLVHEDMQANFKLYPKTWGLKATDKNIDHRRVPNLMTFFGRKGKTLPITNNGSDYKPGDIVCWSIGSLTHIGIVVDNKNWFSNRYNVVHNAGWGQVCEDFLFDYKIIGHYLYGG
jgi:uncharacterized protein